MTDHAWTLNHLAAHVAGGLDAEEAARLERHVRECAECAAALDAAGQLDRGLDTLFADVRPGPALEDRAIQRLRMNEMRRPVLAGWPRRVLVAAGVLLALGTFGGLAGSLVSNGRLPMPGQDRSWAAAPNDRALTTSIEAMDGAEAKPQMKFRGGGPVDEVTDLRNEDTAWGSAGSGGEPDPLSNGQWAAVPHPPGMKPVAPSAGKPPGGFGGGGFGGFGGGNVGGGGFGGGGIAGNGNFSQFTYGNPYYQGVAPPAGYFRPGALKPGTPADAATPEPPKDSGGKDPKAPDGEPKPKPADEPKKTEPPKAGDPPMPDPVRRVVIRSGEIEFEVESFDGASATVTKLITAINGAFIGTVSSEKLPNGKVKGSITVRVPPDKLDGLVLDLRKELAKGGELKGVRISSQDITKQYTDLESRLRAARTMEQRLLQIIKEGKGEIKQLLEAEKELGVWRTKIEEVEGELRYFSNLAALSTLTITLAEKEIRAAAEVTENERVQAGVEVEDVDKTYQQLLAAIAEAKGRVSRSEMKQLAAGQFNASLNFEVAPEQAGPLRDRLRQLGRVARLEIDRVQQASGTVPKDAKPRRGDTTFLVQLYNLANIAPRETAVLQVAVADVPAAYQALRDAVAKATGRVLTAQLNEQDRQNVTAQFDFEVRRSEEAAVRAALDAAGEVVSRQVIRAPEGDEVTDTKMLFRATLLAANRLKPRETTTLAVEVTDVEQTATAFGAMAAEAKGRPVGGSTSRERTGRVTAKLVYEVPLPAAAGLVERFKNAGIVRVQQSTRDPQAADGKYATARIDVTISSADRIVDDDGLWPPVRKGLSYSASVLLTSVTWVIFGLCVVLPWAVVAVVGYRLVRRVFRSAPATTAA